MSTSISSDTSLRPPVMDVPHAQAPAAQAVEADTSEAPAITETPSFTSPVIKVDGSTGLALLVVRDGETGKELEQYPSHQVVREYKRNMPPQSEPQQHQAAAPEQTVQDVKAPPAPVAAAPAASPAPQAQAAPSTSPGGNSIKV